MDGWIFQNNYFTQISRVNIYWIIKNNNNNNKRLIYKIKIRISFYIYLDSFALNETREYTTFED